MIEGREKLILAILLSIGIVLILTNTASAYWPILPPSESFNITV